MLSPGPLVWSSGVLLSSLLRGGEKVAGDGGRGAATHIVVHLVGQGLGRLGQLVDLLLEVSHGLVEIVSPGVGLAVSTVETGTT